MKRIRLLGIAAAAATLAGAGALLAADRSSAAWTPPLSEHRVTTAAGYRFTVHPAFSSRAVLRGANGEQTEMYRQTATYDLPDGRTAPPTRHEIRLDGGALARELGITVNDPKHQVARITVELYGPDHVPGRDSRVAQTLVVENAAVTCPWTCSEARPDSLPPSP